MTRPLKIILLLSVGTVLFICCLLPAGCTGYGLINRIVNPIDPDTGRVTVTAGTVEVIIPRARKPGEVFVSPTGRWLVFRTDGADNWLLDTQTGQEQPLDFDPYIDIRWLNENQFFAGGSRIVDARDLSILQLKGLDTSEVDINALEVLRGAKQVYLLTGQGVYMLSGDPAYPYSIGGFLILPDEPIPGSEPYGYMLSVLQERFPETEIPTNVVLVKSRMVIWPLGPSQDDIYTLT